MAEAVVSFVVKRIGYLLVQEYELVYGVEDNVKDLEKEPKVVQCFLKVADEKKYEDENARSWVSEIRDLDFRIENVLENFASKQERDCFKRFIEVICECLPGHCVGSQIFQATVFVTRYIATANDKEQLVSHLGSMDKHDAVITIKGIGGPGKTTMATRIYNHYAVRDKFTNFAWVCVTQTCQKKNIWQDILKQLSPEALYKIQQEKKCLVVLDDIWSSPVGGTIIGSKLLLTTRKLDAKVGRVHVLGHVDDDEAWLLLQKKAFPGNEGSPEFGIQLEMEKIGQVSKER